ncbi:MAG: glycolate oxidase subunit GlcF [Hydrogenophilales bacterium]
MKSNLLPKYLDTYKGQRAKDIIKACVHCGFCTATCPSYQVLGNELDSPRGRIYLIKDFLEGEVTSKKTQLHLDRCLTCRSCETTCPSGVKYGELIDIGRTLVEKSEKRNILDVLFRKVINYIFLNRSVLNLLLFSARFFRVFLPNNLKKIIPASQKIVYPVKKVEFQDQVIFFKGCVQDPIYPNINAAAEFILNSIGIKVILSTDSRCCGALSHHMNLHSKSEEIIKENVNYLYNELESNKVKNIISTITGCGLMIKDYHEQFGQNSPMHEKAKKISQSSMDIFEFILNNEKLIFNFLKKINFKPTSKRIVYHPPCTMQHGLKINNQVEKFLLKIGYKLNDFDEKHLCCGSAGTYSIFQKKIANTLRSRKIKNLTQEKPDIICTSNIGCILHLEKGSDTKVIHWIEMFANDILKYSGRD